MKYYGFKFEKSLVEKSKLNQHVSTWIGLCGTFLFIVYSADVGGFRGKIGDEVIFTVIYPVLLWFISYLGIERVWPKIVIIIVSGLAMSFALFINYYTIILGDRIIPTFVLFLIFNIGVFFLSIRKTASGLDNKG